VNFFVRFARSIFDNALYPVMVSDYLSAIIPGLDRWHWRLLVTFASVGYAIACNLFGLEAVGWVSFVLTFIIVTPFVLFVAFAAGFMTPDRVFAKFPVGVDGPNIGQLLATVMWQFSGFDTLAALSAETINPRRTFPLAMFMTVILVTAVYLLPTIAGLSAQPDVREWSSGAFAKVARLLPHCQNGWLSFWISLGGALAALSLLNVALSCTGREFYAGGSIGAVPFVARFFGKMHANCRDVKLPLRGIVFMAVLTLPMSLMDFGFLVNWSGFLGALAQICQASIFIALRIPSYMQKVRRRQAEENASMLEALVEEQREVAVVPIGEEELQDKNKFVIGGGWPIAMLLTVSLIGSCVFLIVMSGWQSAVATLAYLVVAFCAKGLEWGIRKMSHRCARNDTVDIEPSR
jgi:amino acid transporter